MPFEAPDPKLTTALGEFAKALSKDAAFTTVKISSTSVPQIDVRKRRYLFINNTSADLETASTELRKHLPTDWDASGLSKIVFGVSGQNIAPRSSHPIRLGITALPLHQALADLIGLPEAWYLTQLQRVERTLEPVLVDGETRVARLNVVNGTTLDADSWLASTLSWSGKYRGRLIYVCAEAGKGKSTLLAHHVRNQLLRSTGPLPLFIPLRDLHKGGGISWDAIAMMVGTFGPSATDLIHATRSGLTLLVLDGLDEVSGRYDPNVVIQVINLVSSTLISENTLLAISGRTTEGKLLASKQAWQAGLELPDLDDPSFSDYTSHIINRHVPGWPAVSARIPEPPLGERILSTSPLLPHEFDALLQWILFQFEDFGKERSLFFVQSLACIGRTIQLQGKPLIIDQGDQKKAHACWLYDVCILAAALACVREQDKIEDIAQEIFEPSRQLDLLTWIALHASTDEAKRLTIERVNELTHRIFAIDPVNQNEELTAVLRQIQKHALLYSSSEGLTVGDWKPTFLSDWIRCALIVRAWRNRNTLPCSEGKRELISSIIATALRSKIAFSSIFPDWLTREPACAEPLFLELIKQADKESPEASSNFWAAYAGLSDELRERQPLRPKHIVEFSELSELHFEGLQLGKEFSANLAFFVATTFSNCTFNNVQFTACDMSSTSFASCAFDNVTFKDCSGPITFEDCVFSRCHLSDVQGKLLPGWTFIDCMFLEDTRIVQTKEPHPETSGREVVKCTGCSTKNRPEELFVGDWIGNAPRRIAGINVRNNLVSEDPALECLRRVLRPFFPTRAGNPEERQARGYIRSSALGRGAFPPGSPHPTTLRALLEAEGFTSGGRQGHLYAPWSSVAGVTRPDLRSELLAFLKNGSRGPTVERMLTKVRKECRPS